MPKKTKVVANGLLKKGFQVTNSRHKKYHLYHNGKKTPVHTEISHGASEIPDNLLGAMARQLRLKRTQLEDLVECPMSEEAFKTHLSGEGVIEPEQTDPPDDAK